MAPGVSPLSQKRASYRTRRLLAALDDIILKVQDQVFLEGQPMKALYDNGIVTVSIKANGSWDEMVLSVIHELWHHVDMDLKEYVIDEALDRAAFGSNKLKWEVSRHLGDAALGFEKVVEG